MKVSVQGDIATVQMTLAKMGSGGEKMLVQCRRCRREVECKFYGSSGDIGEGLADSGVWICEGCYYPFLMKAQGAVEALEKALEDMDDDEDT